MSMAAQEVPRPNGVRRRRTLTKAVGIVSATACVAGLAGFATMPSAHAQGSGSNHIKVIAKGLNGPREVSAYGRNLLVAQSDTGRITWINRHTGHKRVLVRNVPNAQGVVARAGRIFIAVGAAPPQEGGGSGPSLGPGLYVARPGGKARLFADTTAFEKKHNPDGQIQNNQDSVTNPYYVIRDRSRHGFLLLADAGANDVLKIDRHGHIRTFFVPKVIKTCACATTKNNTKSGFGCDPVPTGLAYGPHGLLYISALASEVKGQGRVYVVNRRGHLVRTIRGFTAPTGVAVNGKGTVFASELLQGAPEGPPPANFDPSTIGQIVRVPQYAHRTYAQVTMPSGLLFDRHKLYSAAWAIAGQPPLNMKNKGQVVRVGRHAFTRTNGGD
jgi:hypothetical protein